MTNIDLKNTVQESFAQYAGAVIQSRALVDVRDCVKPSARQIYYAMFTDNYVHSKPFNKTLKSIGSSMRFYIHGDSSCEGIIMRSGQPFAMRYPLVEVEGSYGTLTDTGNWAAPRYTSARLSELTDYLIKDTSKHIVDEWVDNYDDTEQYPRVLSSLGFYNIVNGSMGIAVGVSSSIPAFNLTEVNNALITLLKNPNAAFDDIVCFPDFATGATIINKDEVYESLKKGSGKGCLIRSTIEYDKKNNALVVKDLPYGVYTNTICNEITKLVDKNPDCGIVNINDLTGENVNIKIYLSKNVNPNEIISLLYEKTSLESSYAINMTMLENGRFPKVFGWKECLQAHLEHEKHIYTNMYNYELSKLESRLNIVNGIILAINKIDEVINIIKTANSTKDAAEKLISLLGINAEQAKAILDIKLSRLAKLESDKMLKEKEELESSIKKIQDILNSEELLKNEMIKRFNEVIKKFGDERRTKITQETVTRIAKKANGKKAAEPETVVAVVNSDGYIKSIPVKSYKKTTDELMAIKTIDQDDMVRVYTNLGKLYRIQLKAIKKCAWNDKGTALGSILELSQGEKIIAADCINAAPECDYIAIAASNGMIKKVKLSDYNATTRSYSGVKYINLKDDAEVIGIQYGKEGDIFTLETNENVINFSSDELSYAGKTAAGVKGITLVGDDKVVNFKINKSKNIKIQKRGGKGCKRK